MCALGAAVCFGTATVLQAMAARSAAATGPGGDVALLWRALRQRRYLLGLALDGLGFVLRIVSLRSVPIHAVGAAPAASLAVTAVVAARLLGVRLSRMEWGAVGVVLGGGAAFLLLSSALQGGSVTTATAGLVLGETGAPALIGVVWVGDRTRPGLGRLAVLGFAVAVAGALALSRFGEAPVESEGGAAEEDAVAPK
ncbi:hypothetical protein GCM10010270_61030 [Streptomyces violaceus]|nr:hypothetical protein GCM10010270_61030 [Streptomyces janthinus]